MFHGVGLFMVWSVAPALALGQVFVCPSFDIVDGVGVVHVLFVWCWSICACS